MKTLTDNIFELTAPYDNPYQGKDHRALFVCSAGLLRSATMANLYAKYGWNTRAAGSSEYALVPVSVNLLAWANQIYYVNIENARAVNTKFSGKGFDDKLSNAVILNIPDIYEYNDPELIAVIKEQMDD